MAVFELRYHNPCGDNTKEGNSKIETDAHKVVGITFGLHPGQVSDSRPYILWLMEATYAHATV